MTQSIRILIVLWALAVLVAIYFSLIAVPVKASDATNIKARVATTSNPTVGTTALTLFATTSCATRMVTTYASPVMLTFSDYSGQTPTGTFGHLQAASTTVAYDAGQYGCDLVKVYSYASQAITVSESR